MRDHHRSALYAAERMAFGVFDRAGPTRGPHRRGRHHCAAGGASRRLNRSATMSTGLWQCPPSWHGFHAHQRRSGCVHVVAPPPRRMSQPRRRVIAIPETASGRWALRGAGSPSRIGTSSRRLRWRSPWRGFPRARSSTWSESSSAPRRAHLPSCLRAERLAGTLTCQSPFQRGGR